MFSSVHGLIHSLSGTSKRTVLVADFQINFNPYKIYSELRFFLFSKSVNFLYFVGH